MSFVDVARKPPAPTELRRFAERYGAAALFDKDSRAYRDAGLGYLLMGDTEMFERILADPRLLKLPLVRAGSNVTIGVDEAAWRGWLAA